MLPMMLSPAVAGNFWTFLYQPQIGLFNYVVPSSPGADVTSFSMIGDVAAWRPWAIVIVDTWDVDALRDADLPRRGCGVHPRHDLRGRGV